MSRNLGKQKIKFHLNIPLTITLGLMAIFSVIAIYGASPLISSSANLYKQQVLWFVIGIGAVIFLVWFGTDRLFTGIRLFYWILVGMLVVLIVARLIGTTFGVGIPFIPEINGTYGWFVFFNVISFQPAEFMKIVLIIYAAYIVNQHNQTKTADTFASDFSLFFKLAKIYILPVALILMQPETGIVLIMAISLFIMLAIGGIRKEWIFFVLIVVMVVFVGVVYLYYNHQNLLIDLLGGNYKATRILGWLDTEKYRNTYGYQLYAAQLAFGTAGFTGHGLLSFVTKFQAAETDFIFATISQDFGLYGGLGVILLCLFLDLQLIRIAYRYPRAQEKYVVAGVLGMLIFQQLQSLSMVLGIMPITGITLPFFSYGGSSLLSYMIPFAIIYHMSSETENIGTHFR